MRVPIRDDGTCFSTSPADLGRAFGGVYPRSLPFGPVREIGSTS